jgi:hypothetical protein
MSRQENRHNRPGMDLVRDEVSYGVCPYSLSTHHFYSYFSYVMKFDN